MRQVKKKDNLTRGVNISRIFGLLVHRTPPCIETLVVPSCFGRIRFIALPLLVRVCVCILSPPPARYLSRQDDGDLSARSSGCVDEADMQQSVCESRQAIAEGDRLLAGQLEVTRDVQ